MKTINVGWFIEDTHKAKFVFNEPFPVKKNRKIPLSKRAVQACPAINHFEKRYFQVNFPYDLRLRYEFEHEKHNLYVIPENTRIDDDLIPQNVVLMPPKFWRDENFPTIQIMCPYVFVSDEEVFMSQLPPFLDYKHGFEAYRYQEHHSPKALVQSVPASLLQDKFEPKYVKF